MALGQGIGVLPLAGGDEALAGCAVEGAVTSALLCALALGASSARAADATPTPPRLRMASGCAHAAKIEKEGARGASHRVSAHRQVGPSNVQPGFVEVGCRPGSF